MRFDEKEDVIAHMKSIAGEFAEIEDHGNEIICKIPDRETEYLKELEKTGNVIVEKYDPKMEDYLKATREAGQYGYELFINRNGRWVRANG